MKRRRVLIGLGVIAALLIFFFGVLFLIGGHHGGKTEPVRLSGDETSRLVVGEGE